MPESKKTSLADQGKYKPERRYHKIWVDPKI